MVDIDEQHCQKEADAQDHDGLARCFFHSTLLVGLLIVPFSVFKRPATGSQSQALLPRWMLCQE
jgi:hypothetical protein